RVLADAEVDVPASGVLDVEVGVALEGDLGRAAQVRGAPEDPGDLLRQRVEHLSGGLTGGHPLRVGGEDRQIAVPAVGELGPLDQLQLPGELGELLPVALAEVDPLLAELLPPQTQTLVEVLPYAVGHQELRVLRPPIGPLCGADLI